MAKSLRTLPMRNKNGNSYLGRLAPCKAPTADRNFAYMSEMHQSVFDDGKENDNNNRYFYSSQAESAYSAAPKLSFADAPENIVDWGDSDTVLKLATDRDGIQLLASIFPASGSTERKELYAAVLGAHAFDELIDHASGNFLIQKMIDQSTDEEMRWVESMLANKLISACSGSYGCRVVQKMVERLQEKSPERLPGFIGKLAGHECELAVAQTGSHVLQKIFTCTPFEIYEFILDAFVKSNATLEAIVEDKYGCRVIQLALQQLKIELSKKRGQRAEAMFDKIVSIMKEKPLYFISHQYANYIMQDLLCLEMENFPDLSTQDGCSTADQEKRTIITCTLLANLLSLSQEKHASHVVEKAFLVAADRALCAMMNDIFDGYETDRDGNDALHVLMFDQYGNYVVQTMIDVALQVKKGNRRGKNEWYERLVERVTLLQNRLINFSSGKRILQKLVEAGALPQFAINTTSATFPSIPAKFQ